MLDLIITLCLIFALFAGLVSSLHELISDALEMRGKVLFEGVASFLGELNNCGRLRRWFGRVERLVETDGGQAPATPLTSLLFAHPCIDSLSQPGSKPSYMDASCFADTLLNLWQNPDTRAQFGNTPIGQLMNGFINDAAGDMVRVKTLIEVHYDRVMERVGGWYRRRAKAMMFVLSFVLASGLNIDVLYVINHLQNNPKLVADLVETASKTEVAVEFTLPDKTAASADAQDLAALNQQLATLNQQINGLQSLNLPIGWKLNFDKCHVLCSIERLPQQQAPLLGWLLTAIAGTLGAPFWFDVLNRLLPLKGKPAEKTAPAKAPESS